MVTKSNHHARQQPGSKAPISSHPAFPAIVALWFAALLGIGSLIVPAVLFEKLVAITGLGAILPSAQPPLGDNARLIIALIGAGIGGATGLLLARRVTAAQVAHDVPGSGPESDEGQPAAYEAKRPISAMEELGALSLDQPVDDDPNFITYTAGSMGGRRRGLTATGDVDSSDRPEVLSNPSTPSETPEAPIQQREPSFDETEIETSQADDPLELTDYEAPSAAASEPGTNELETREVESAEAPADEPAAGMTTEQLIAHPLNQLGMVHLVERFALSLQRHDPARDQDTAESLGPDAEEVSADSLDEACPPVLKMPDALRPIEHDFDLGGFEEEHEDDYLPVIDLKTMLARPDPAAAEVTQNDDNDSDNYSSLLSINKALDRPERSGPSEETRSVSADTVALFPGQDDCQTASATDAENAVHQGAEPARRRFDPPTAVPVADAPIAGKAGQAATERALRDALEKLQKMSGVG